MYTPPYTITNKILLLVADICEQVGKVYALKVGSINS